MIDRQQQRILDHFRRSITSYDNEASVQKTVGDDLVSRLAFHPGIAYGRVLEVGCCTGSMTETLCRTYTAREIWVNDLVPECCELAAARVLRYSGTVHQLAGDIEQLELPCELDLIVSSSTFQWLRDLPGSLDRFAAALGEGGCLAFSLFGPGTMEQVRELIGVGLKYVGEKELVEMVRRRYTVLERETRRHRLHFASPAEVLRHIRKTGVGGAGDYRWTAGKLKDFDRNYRQRFGSGLGIPLDYVATRIIARKR